MTTQGVYYVAIGSKATLEVSFAVKDLARYDHYPIIIQRDKPDLTLTNKPASRQLKTELFQHTAWDQVCYMDADTRAYTSIQPGFDILQDGWDMVVTPSNNQGVDLFWHIGEQEREATLSQIGNCDPLQLQAGAFWIARNERTETFMELWQSEWLKYKDEDQAAFIRALYRSPLKVWLLGNDWNGGSAIGHRWGALRNE